MMFIPKGRKFKLIGILFLMIAAAAPSAFGKVVLGIYGGGRLSKPTQSPTHYDWQTDVTWAAGSHIGYFVQFYSETGHWGIRLELLKLKYKETYGYYSPFTDPILETHSETYSYFGVSFEYSVIWKTTQRLIPFIGLGIMTHPYIVVFGDKPDFPPEGDLKADLGLKFKIFDFVDLKAQLFYALGNKLLAGSLGIDFSL
jgi:hypothetical protein